jgi:hypothetical protein
MRLFVTLMVLACTNEVALAANPDNGSTLGQRWCTGSFLALLLPAAIWRSAFSMICLPMRRW